MKRLLGVACLLCWAGLSWADDNAYFKAGPLELNIPLKTTSAAYLYDFQAKKNLVGAETPVFTLWSKVSGTVGVVTSLDGTGAPFGGAHLELGNILDKWVSLGNVQVGGFGGRDFRADAWMYGLKASTKLW